MVWWVTEREERREEGELFCRRQQRRGTRSGRSPSRRRTEDGFRDELPTSALVSRGPRWAGLRTLGSEPCRRPGELTSSSESLDDLHRKPIRPETREDSSSRARDFGEGARTGAAGRAWVEGRVLRQAPFFETTVRVMLPDTKL